MKSRPEMAFMKRTAGYVPLGYKQCVNDQRDAQYLPSVLFDSFSSVLHVSNESSRSSSGARHNILYYAVWYNRYNRAG